MSSKAEQSLDLEALEAMLDRHGTDGVLEMLAEICGEKAVHLEVNWQDTQSAQWWTKRAEAFDKLAARPFMQD